MSSALVLFESSRTCDIVPVSAVLGEVTLNSVMKNLWREREILQAKFIFTGPEEICAVKIGQVTERGQLVEEDEFDIVTDPIDPKEVLCTMCFAVTAILVS